MRLADYSDEALLDLIADIIDPMDDLLSDVEIYKAGENIFNSINENEDAPLYMQFRPVLQFIKVVLKKHKKSLIEILARVQGVPAADYHANFKDMTQQVIDIITDVRMVGFFRSSADAEVETASADATENMPAAEKK